MIRKELSIFLMVGGLTVLVDYLAYRGIVWTSLLETNQAKGIGFLSGTLFAYFANRLWTFGSRAHAPGSVWRFVMLYAATLLVNVLFNALMLHLFVEQPYSVQVAFLIATGASATINFLGMKHFVFVDAPASEAT